MVVRDLIVAGVLGGGALLALVAWRAAGPWDALAVAVVAMIAAAGAYRIDSHRRGRGRLRGQ